MTFWNRHVPVTPDAAQYLIQHGNLEVFAPNEYFMRPHQRKPYWCIVLEGLACGYWVEPDGKQYIRWFAEPLQGFAGVRHLYTPRKSDHYIQFLQASRILSIPASTMRTAKERFPEVSELLHVMKQHYINRLDSHIAILQEPSAYERYARFNKEFPTIVQKTTVEHQIAFINIARPTYYRVLGQYLAHRRNLPKK